MPTPRIGETREEMNTRQRERRRFIPQRQSATFDASGNLKQQSISYAPEREKYEPLSNALLTRRSTLVDAEGKVLQAWQIEKAEDRQRLEAWREMAKSMAEELPRIAAIAPPADRLNNLITLYPIGDHHLGMLAWKHEVGRSYDLDIGERLLTSAVRHLVSISPASGEALVIFLGDYMHYDSMNALTPNHGNLLDADGRAAKMVRVAVRTMRQTIETAAAKHARVRVIIEFGNHDPFSTLWLIEAMTNIYEDNARITIDPAPGSYHYYRFGLNLFGTHHGDKAKASSDKLPQIMAADRPEEWGATKYRLWLTGHIHSRSAYDYQGCTVESFRILAPVDAYAHGLGYRGYRDMKAIVFDAEHGEQARYSINPNMLETQP